MQIRWKLDLVSIVSVAVVVALVCSLPSVPLAGLLLVSELVFGLVVAPWKLRRIAADNEACATSQAGRSWRLVEGLRVLQRLLDPEEAHADLLRDPTWFRGWFRGVETLESIRLGNVSEFLCYTLWHARPGSPPAGFATVAPGPTTDRLLRSCARRFVRSLGLPLGSPAASRLEEDTSCTSSLDEEPSGSSLPPPTPTNEDESHNPEASFFAHTSEPIKAAYRPLVFYLITELVGIWGHYQLIHRQGFKVAGENDIATFYVSHPAAGPMDGASETSSALPPLVSSTASDWV